MLHWMKPNSDNGRAQSTRVKATPCSQCYPLRVKTERKTHVTEFVGFPFLLFFWWGLSRKSATLYRLHFYHFQFSELKVFCHERYFASIRGHLLKKNKKKNDTRQRAPHVSFSSTAALLGEALEFIVAGPPLGVVRDVVDGLQHQMHELLHVKGVVGELGMVSQRGVVTLVLWE